MSQVEMVLIEGALECEATSSKEGRIHARALRGPGVAFVKWMEEEIRRSPDDPATIMAESANILTQLMSVASVTIALHLAGSRSKEGQDIVLASMKGFQKQIPKLIEKAIEQKIAGYKTKGGL